MSRTLGSDAWQWIAIATAVASAAALVYALVGTPRGAFFLTWGKYVDYLGRRLRRLHVFDKAHRVAGAQLAVVFGILGLAALDACPYWYALVAAVLGLPAVVIERRIRERVAQLDVQADAFCLALANALKSTASVAAAVDTASALMSAPVSDEIQLAVKETRLGRSLGDALEEASKRAGSHKLATVLSAVLIGRQVGGNLPQILDTTASTLREMERLEGVVRQKTADGRMQMWALSLAPGAICWAIQRLDAHYFEPLTSTTIGYIAVAIAIALYVAGVVVARKVLAVDI